MTLGRWAAGIVLCLWTQLGFAAGSSSPQVALQIDDCAAVAQEDVRRWLQLELGEQVLTLADASSSSSVARVTCEEPGRLSLRIDDPLTGKSIWRSIDLSSQAESVRARLLAVAIAELLYASFAELLLDQRAEVATPKPTQPVAVVKAWSGLLEDKLKQPLPPLGSSWVWSRALPCSKTRRRFWPVAGCAFWLIRRITSAGMSICSICLRAPKGRLAACAAIASADGWRFMDRCDCPSW